MYPTTSVRYRLEYCFSSFDFSLIYWFSNLSFPSRRIPIMFTIPALVAHSTEPAIISWPAGPGTALKEHGSAKAPKIVCTLLADSVDTSVPSLSPDSYFGAPSSTTSSPVSNRSSFPNITIDNHHIANTPQKELLCYDFNALSFTPGRKNQALTEAAGKSYVESPKCYQKAAASTVRINRDRYSSAKKIVVNLTYPDNLAITNEAPKTRIMDINVHFQVLIGSLAHVLSVSPELFDLTIQQNSQIIKLSPIASPRQLGFHSDLEIKFGYEKLERNLISSHPVYQSTPSHPRHEMDPQFSIKDIQIWSPVKS
ncbi:hypothetical protein PSHT_08546 [Puccinia striiformis]|uniref:Uncharacterized protein n=1 Tax=Puccinia striiformis TaxID=27350 RepID=A0A2S4VPE6_9BASI|nr:hypothetical protein PSHT_08546 [Puccinia striiformis]